MAWSTRELAQLAGTGVPTVRHYHRVGLLAEPERAANGYKRYGVPHLVRLLRIKRLTGLGFSLPQIAAMGADEPPDAALRALDVELAATIERLQQARAEVALILRHGVRTDLPPALAPAAADLSAADRAFVNVITRSLAPPELDTYEQLLRALPDAVPAGFELNELRADADERTRGELVERLVPQIRDLYANHPGLADVGATSDARRVVHAIDIAMADFYNPAQIDVLRRTRQRLRTD